MGEANTAVNQWLSDNKRFADLFNGTLFQGEEVIRPEGLEELDRETDVLLGTTGKRGRAIQRYRDIVKRWKKGATLAVLACESQERVHYAMPVRNMLYDSLTYTDQIRELWRQRKERWDSDGKEGSRLSSEEYLSRLSKEDKLYPVITLVFYYDLKQWDGAVELYDLFAVGGSAKEQEILRKFIPNYRINLVDAGNMEELERFHMDLQQIFGMLKCRGKKEELKKYIWQNQMYFRNIDVETYQAIRAFLHAENRLKDIEKIQGLQKEGKIDMCQAMEEWYADAIREGQEAGEQAGRQEEAIMVVKNMLRNGFSAGDIEKYTGITGQEIRNAQKCLEE